MLDNTRAIKAIERGLTAVMRATLSAGLKVAINQRFKTIYQPIPWLGINTGARGIPTVMRWQALSDQLDGNILTATDIGCNVGYFVFRMAEKGIKCLGLDSAPFAIYLSKVIKATCGFRDTKFVCTKLSPTNISELKSSDVMVCLSVYHHFVVHFGKEDAKDMMKELLRKTNNILFFETGQSEETYMGWAKKLPDMGNDSAEWIRSFLLEIGASKATVLGKFPTYLGNKDRYLFAAYK
jgi:hypothetical protein